MLFTPATEHTATCSTGSTQSLPHASASTRQTDPYQEPAVPGSDLFVLTELATVIESNLIM